MASPAGSHEDLKLERSKSEEVSNASSNKKKFSTCIGPKFFSTVKQRWRLDMLTWCVGISISRIALP